MTQPPVQEQGPEYWRKRAGEVAREFGLDPGQFTRLVSAESGGFATDVVYGRRLGGSGEIGIGQFMPATAADYGFDPYDPEQNLRHSAQYIKDLYRDFGDWRQAYAAYAGPGWLRGRISEYGRGWEQALSTTDPAQYQKLQYIFGGPAAEKAIVVPSGMEKSVYQRGLISGGIRLAGKSPFADVPEYFAGYPDLLDRKLGEIDLLSKQLITNEEATAAAARVSNIVSDAEVYAWYSKMGWTREEVALGRVALSVSAEARALGLELRAMSEPERQRYLAERVPPVGPVAPSLRERVGRMPSWEEAQQAVRDAKRASVQGQIDVHISTIDQLMHEQAIFTMMQLLPMLIASDQVSTVDDAITWFRTNAAVGQVGDSSNMSRDVTQSLVTAVNFTQEDREFISYLIQNLSPALDLTPDIPASEILDALAAKNRPKPKLLSAMTSDQIHRMLFGMGKPFELPEQVTEPQVRAMFRRQGMTDQEYLDEVASAKQAASQLALDWFSRQQDYLAYREGWRLPEIPDPSFMDQLRAGFMQPASALGDAAAFFRDYVSKPFAANEIRSLNQIAGWFNLPPIKGTQSLEESFQRNLAGGASFWEANAEAFDDWEAPGVVKFAAEVGFDPTTYIGLGAYPALTRRVPVLGPLVGALERGWVTTWDIPFRMMGKAYRTIVPKTLEQIASERSKDAIQYVVAKFAQHTGRQGGAIGLTDASAIREFVEQGIGKYIQDPVGTRTGGPAWEVGAYLVQRSQGLIQPADVSGWAKALGSTAEITDQVIFDLNFNFSQLLGSGIHGFQKAPEMAQTLLARLGVEATDESLRKALGLITARVSSDAGVIPKLLRGDVVTALESMGKSIEKTFLANTKSRAWKFAEISGRSMAIARIASGPLKWTPLLMLDRLAVQPIASSYLLFLGYGPMNFIESTFRMARAGFEPELARSMRPESLGAVRQMWGYLPNLPDEIGAVGAAARMEVAVLPSRGVTRYGEGPIATLIGGIPGIGRELPFANIKFLNKIPRPLWSLQNFNDFWSRVSTYQRALYIHKQMLKQLNAVAPEQMGKIADAFDAVGDPEQLGILGFLTDRATRQEGYERMFTAAIHSPDSLLGLRTSMEKLQARKYTNDVLAILDAHPEIEREYANALLQKARNGELTVDTLDETIQATFSAIQDGALGKLPARAQALKNWADEVTGNVVYERSGLGDRLEKFILEDAANPSSPVKIVDRMTEGTYILRDGRMVDVGDHKLYAASLGERAGLTPSVTEIDIKSADAVGGFVLEETGAIRAYRVPVRAEIGLELFGPPSREQIATILREMGDSTIMLDVTRAGKVVESGTYRVKDHVRKFLEKQVGGIYSGMSKSEARATFREITDVQTQAEEVLDTHYRTTTKRGLELTNPLEKDKLHTQEFADMMDFASTYQESVSRVLDSLRANATQVFEEGAERTNMLRYLDNLQDRYQLAVNFHAEQRRIIDDGIAAAPSRSKVNWQAIADKRSALWDEYYKAIIPLNEAQLRAAWMIDPTGLHGTIDQVTGRLAPVNVARLFATSGDDLSRGMNQVMLYGGLMSRERFITYVKSRANVLADAAGRTSDELGFTEKAISRVYDQIMAKLKLDPNIGGLLEPIRQSLEGVRGEIHQTLMQKGIQPEDVDKLNKFLQDTSDALKRSGLFMQAGEEIPPSEVISFLKGPTVEKVDHVLRSLADQPISPTGGDVIHVERIMDALRVKTGEGVRAVAGMDPRILKTLAGNLYSGDMGKIAAKELLQNSVDAVRPLGKDGRVDLKYFSGSRKLEIKDNGVGMLPEVATEELVNIGGSLKYAGSSGGFGIAKVAIFSNAERISISTVAKKAEGQWIRTMLTGSGDDWLDPSVGLRVTTSALRAPSTKTGTEMSITLRADARTSGYAIDGWLKQFAEVQGLDARISLKYNGDPVKAVRGRDAYTKMTTLDVPGADIDVYVSKSQTRSYSIDSMLLNNGLPQFSKPMYMDHDLLVPDMVIFDVRPKADPTHPNYPFRPDREGLRQDAEVAVTKFVKESLAHTAVQGEIAIIEKALRSAPKLLSGQLVLDTTGKLPSALARDLSRRGYLNEISDVIGRCNDDIGALVSEIFPSAKPGKYLGIGLGPDYLGANIRLGSTYNLTEWGDGIVVNIHKIYNDVAGAEDRLSGWIVGAILHENVHRVTRGHTEEFASVLTYATGVGTDVLSSARSSVRRSIRGIIDRGEIAQWADDSARWYDEVAKLDDRTANIMGRASDSLPGPSTRQRVEGVPTGVGAGGAGPGAGIPGGGKAAAGVPPGMGAGPGVGRGGPVRWEATPEWASLREQAMDKARTQYELDFTQYTRQNAFDAFARTIMPFWSYESQRWPYLARAMIQTPGVFAGWGKYMDYTDTGYIPVKGTDLEINPFRGTVFMGGFRRFSMKDYPEYYDRINPGLTQFMDYASKAGFYPGIHIALPMALWGGQRPQLGEVLPAFMKSGLGAMVGLNIPGARQLQETIFPERFRDYQIGLVVSELAQQRRLDINGPDVLRKRREGIELSQGEQELWDEAARKVARTTALLFETTGMMRLAPPERTAAWKAVDLAREAITGVPVRTQDQIRKLEGATGESFSDLFPLSPLDQERLNNLDAYKYWIGSTSPLLPESYQRVMDRIGTYWERVRQIWDTARGPGFTDDEGNIQYLSLSDLDRQFREGTLSASDYTKMVGDTLDHTIGLAEGLKQDPYFKDVPISLEARTAFYLEHNIPLPAYSPGEELTRMYYELAPKLSQDEEGNYTYDFITYFSQVDAILDSMPDSVRSEFLEYVQRDWTPTQKVYWQSSRDYLRPYRNLREGLIQQYNPEEQRLLRSYTHMDDVEIEALPEPQQELIRDFRSKLTLVHENYREASPETDAWLYFWGKTSTLRSKPAEDIFQDLMRRYRPGAMQ